MDEQPDMQAQQNEITRIDAGYVFISVAVDVLGASVDEPAHAGPAPCQLVDYWCAGEGDRRSQADCDGDGGLDWVCTNPGTGARGASTTSRNCSIAEYLTGWPRADSSVCPNLFKGAPGRQRTRRWLYTRT
jgi:hypothetical protein